jgi:hypothetical protein
VWGLSLEGIGTLYGGGQKLSLGLGAKVKVTHACSSNDNTAPAFARKTTMQW